MRENERTAREEAVDRYLTEAYGVKLTRKGELPTPPSALTEREVVQAVARLLGITEQTVRRRYMKVVRDKIAQRETEIARLRKMISD